MSDLVVQEETLITQGKSYRCAVGHNGFTHHKLEGDGKTPLGRYPLRRILFRADRLEQPETVLPTSSLASCDGWSDDPQDLQDYNRFVALPHSFSHEQLWRQDHTYDIIVVVGYNDDPVVPGKGSAIFMHLARQEYTGTRGCVALSLKDMLEILKELDPQSHLVVLGK